MALLALPGAIKHSTKVTLNLLVIIITAVWVDLTGDGMEALCMHCKLPFLQTHYKAVDSCSLKSSSSNGSISNCYYI